MRRFLFTRWIIVTLVGLGWFGCGKDQPLSPGFEQTGGLGKPAAKAALIHRAVVIATVIQADEPASGVEVAFSRSISGRFTDYRWKGTTDENGEVQIEITAEAVSRLRESSPNQKEQRQGFEEAPGRTGGEKLRPYLRNRRNASHPPSRRRQYTQATPHPRLRLQPRTSHAQTLRCRNPEGTGRPPQAPSRSLLVFTDRSIASESEETSPRLDPMRRNIPSRSCSLSAFPRPTSCWPTTADFALRLRTVFQRAVRPDR